MNTAMMSGLLAAMLVAASVPVTAAERERNGVNQRQQYQQQRIQQGVRQGDLTRGETRQLQGEARDIRREEHAFRSDGRFTPAERQQVNRNLDQLSHNIYRERQDGDRRFGRNEGHSGFDRQPRYAGYQGWNGHQGWNGQHYGQGRAFDPRVDRAQAQQRERIAQGIRSGQLTRAETDRLMAEQRSIQAEERRYRADGVLTRAERADLYGDLNAASQHIYNETHDAQTRR